MFISARAHLAPGPPARRYRPVAIGLTALAVVSPTPVGAVPATGERIGVLMANPGGPGISGVAYLRDWGQTLRALRTRYDIVSFDPPGVGGSVPDARCLTARQAERIRAQPSAPGTVTETRRAYRLAALIGNECADLLGPALADMSTLNAAAVMDRLRAALRERRIAYLGFSYGTLLGAAYADRYPGRTSRVVVDGAMDPTVNNDRVRRDQAVTLDMATERFIRNCPRHRDCPLTGDPRTDMTTLIDPVAQVDAEPYRSNGRVLSGLRALNLIQSSMYFPPYGWEVLRGVLGPALDGDLEPMLDAAYSPDNMVNPADPEYLAVMCEDLADMLDTGRYLEWVGEGHLAYDGGRGGTCVVRTVEDFLLDGVRPPQRRVCR